VTVYLVVPQGTKFDRETCPFNKDFKVSDRMVLRSACQMQDSGTGPDDAAEFDDAPSSPTLAGPPIKCARVDEPAETADPALTYNWQPHYVNVSSIACIGESLKRLPFLSVGLAARLPDHSSSNDAE
jgi:hypothetical protein